ncbi:MAG: N-acetyltransferase family protein [Nocardioidaceae bacterium]
MTAAATASPSVRFRPAGGGIGTLRPLCPGETAALEAVFAGLSPASRAARYLTGMARLPASMAAVLADVDGWEHVAWLAEVDGRPAGIARYVRCGPASAAAELAVEVVDAHQGRGVGAVLVDAVTTHAAHAGVRRLHATLRADNGRARRLVQRLGACLTVDGDVIEARGPLRLLDPPVVDRDAVRAAADRYAGGPLDLTA